MFTLVNVVMSRRGTAFNDVEGIADAQHAAVTSHSRRLEVQQDELSVQWQIDRSGKIDADESRFVLWLVMVRVRVFVSDVPVEGSW